MGDAKRDGRLESLINARRIGQRRSRKISLAAKLRRETLRAARQLVEPFRRYALVAIRRSVFRKVPFGSAEAGN